MSRAVKDSVNERKKLQSIRPYIIVFLVRQIPFGVACYLDDLMDMYNPVFLSVALFLVSAGGFVNAIVYYKKQIYHVSEFDKRRLSLGSFTSAQ